MASDPQQAPAPNVGKPLNLETKARQNDLVSALKHQGCTSAAAAKAAALAMSHQDEALETALRRAIEYARKAA